MLNTGYASSRSLFYLTFPLLPCLQQQFCWLFWKSDWQKQRTDSANSGDNLCAGPTLTKHALFFAYSRFFAAAVAAWDPWTSVSFGMIRSRQTSNGLCFLVEKPFQPITVSLVLWTPTPFHDASDALTTCGRFERTCGDETMSLCRLEAKPEGTNRINSKTYCWWKKSGDHHLLPMKPYEKWDITITHIAFLPPTVCSVLLHCLRYTNVRMWTNIE